MRRLGAWGVTMALSLSALACGPITGDDIEQQFVGTAVVVDAAGEPIVGQPVDRYTVELSFDGEAGPTTIAHEFRSDIDEAPLRTDLEGRFWVGHDDIDMSYAWNRDELECTDVCVDWDLVCDTYTEEVCLDTCFEDQCWDECYDDCYDETYCDDEDCWTETWCDETCEPVCETVAYDCNCFLDSYDVCSDVCYATTESCEWVTRTYTSTARFEQVTSSRATIGVDGTTFEGEALDAGQQQSLDLWVQKDQFVLP